MLIAVEVKHLASVLRVKAGLLVAWYSRRRQAFKRLTDLELRNSTMPLADELVAVRAIGHWFLSLRRRSPKDAAAEEIANALNISVKTAVFHRMKIMERLGLHSTSELTRYAMEHGIARTTQRVRAKSANNSEAIR